MTQSFFFLLKQCFPFLKFELFFWRGVPGRVRERSGPALNQLHALVKSLNHMSLPVPVVLLICNLIRSETQCCRWLLRRGPKYFFKRAQKRPNKKAQLGLKRAQKMRKECSIQHSILDITSQSHLTLPHTPKVIGFRPLYFSNHRKKPWYKKYIN